MAKKSIKYEMENTSVFLPTLLGMAKFNPGLMKGLFKYAEIKLFS
jgi:hypothetical protein